MTILEVGGLLGLIVGIYIVAHLPAIILIIIGISKLKTNPTNAKTMLIIAGIYIIIGTGICGSMLS